MQPDWYPAWRDQAFEQLTAKNAGLEKEFRLGHWPRYDYDLHMGGYAYLFVRGMRPPWRDGAAQAGVCARLPARELIEALDASMSGELAS